MAFRFKPEYASLLRRLSKRAKVSQVKIIERALDASSKEIAA